MHSTVENERNEKTLVIAKRFLKTNHCGTLKNQIINEQ